jgi:hypothetical protein
MDTCHICIELQSGRSADNQSASGPNGTLYASRSWDESEVDCGGLWHVQPAPLPLSAKLPSGQRVTPLISLSVQHKLLMLLTVSTLQPW